MPVTNDEHSNYRKLIREQNKFNDAIAAMGRDAEYQVDVASTEHEQLASMIQDRIYHVVSKRKSKLLAERDTLDIADTNAVLFHTSQLSITHPASPGGPHSNRKTRHSRHRLEVDEMGTIAESNKRKRKGHADTENGSPSRGVESDTNYPWKEANAKHEAQQLAPLLTLDRLFTEKELILSLQKASRLAVHKMTKRRKLSTTTQARSLKPNTLSKGKAPETQATASSRSSSSDEADPSDLATLLDPSAFTNGGDCLEAPAMDRTANSSHHATRSTGVVSTSTTTFAEDLTLPGDIIGRRTAIDHLGTQREARKREDDYQRATPLSEQEKEADRQAMKRAMEEMGKGRETRRGKTLMWNAVREVVDHMKAAEVLVQESSLRKTLRGETP